MLGSKSDFHIHAIVGSVTETLKVPHVRIGHQLKNNQSKQIESIVSPE